MIPYGKHQVSPEDVAAVVDVLENQFLTQGSMGPAFERALCNYTGADYCTVVNSGTSALHIACLAAGLTQGDLLWTVPNSFVASANCGLYCGADVDFVDINPVTRNIDPDLLEQKLTQAAKQKKLPKVLVVVHFAGASCDMQVIRTLTQDYGIVVIEDAAHALGGQYQGKAVGAGDHSDLVVFSFHPVKSITTAEGGAVLCNDATLAQQVLLYAKHGITRNPTLLQQTDADPWYYEQLNLGFNYRLSDLHSALGLAQLQRLDSLIAERRQLVSRYQQQLADLPLTLPQSVADSAWHLYVVELQQHDRKQVFLQLKDMGIAANVHYIPIYWQPYYQSLGFSKGYCPNAENYYNMALTLPLYPGLGDERQDFVVRCMYEVLN